MDQRDHPAPREWAIKRQRHKLMAGGHKLDGDRSGQRVTRGVALETVVGRGPRKALLFHKDLNGERRNIWAENFQAVDTACATVLRGTVLGSLARARRSEWLQQRHQGVRSRGRVEEPGAWVPAGAWSKVCVVRIPFQQGLFGCLVGNKLQGSRVRAGDLTGLLSYPPTPVCSPS